MSFFSSRKSSSDDNSTTTPETKTETPEPDTSTNNHSSPMTDQNVPNQNQVNLIGTGTVFEGTVRAENDIRASGKVIGTLNVEGKAMIAESGVVEGEVIATNATIAGHVQGKIQVEERLVLKSTARVDSNIDTDRLVVEEGAQFTGEISMSTPIASKGETTENGQATDETLEEQEERMSIDESDTEETNSSERAKVGQF